MDLLRDDTLLLLQAEHFLRHPVVDLYQRVLLMRRELQPVLYAAAADVSCGVSPGCHAAVTGTELLRCPLLAWRHTQPKHGLSGPAGRKVSGHHLFGHAAGSLGTSLTPVTCTGQGLHASGSSAPAALE